MGKQTQNQDHEITPHSFRTKKIKNKTVGIPII